MVLQRNLLLRNGRGIHESNRGYIFDDKRLRSRVENNGLMAGLFLTYGTVKFMLNFFTKDYEFYDVTESY